jgi:hypothetical protein
MLLRSRIPPPPNVESPWVEPSLVGAAVGTATDVIGAVVVLLPGDGCCVGADFLDATLLTGDGLGHVFGGAFFVAAAGGTCFDCAAFFLAAACFFVGLPFGLPFAIFEFMAVANKKVGKG